MATNRRDLDNMEARQADERVTLLDQISALIVEIQSNPPTDLDALTMGEVERNIARFAWVSSLLADLYKMGKRHIAEDIRLRLEFPVGENVTIVPLEGTCPGNDVPHMHILFLPTDDKVNLPHDLRN